MSQPISYELEIPFGKIRKGRGKQIWISNTIGTNGFINWEKGLFEFKQLVFAVHESRQSDKLCFANHVLAKLNTDPQIKNKFVKHNTPYLRTLCFLRGRNNKTCGNIKAHS